MGDGSGAGAERRGEFRRAVRAAYLAEHGVVQDQQIARMLGISRSALCQRFDNVRVSKAGTLTHFLTPINSEALRRSVRDAFEREVEMPAVNGGGSEGYVLSVARLTVANLPEAALSAAEEGLSACEVDAARWELFLQAIGVSFRLAAAGDSVRIAGTMRAWGESMARHDYVAAAMAVNARAMRRAGFPHDECQMERQRALNALRKYEAERNGTQASKSEAAIFCYGVIESENIESVLRVHALKGGQEDTLRNHLGQIAARRSSTARSISGSGRAHQLKARIHLGLGEIAEAERALRQAIEVSENDASARISCGPIIAQALAMRGDVDGATKVLRRLIVICERDRYRYIGGVAQYELARLIRAATR